MKISTISPKCSCVICKKSFSSKSIGRHYICAHTNESKRNSGKGTLKFITKCSCIICHKEITIQSLSQHLNAHYKNPKSKECPNCKIIHSTKGKFCSRKCAASRLQTQEHKNKIANSLRNYERPQYTKISFCKICNKWFSGKLKTCSKECLSKAYSLGGSSGGKISASKQVKRSKNEIALYELCLTHFQDVEHNQPIFEGWDADIIIHDTKTAILWNGPWHYVETGLKNHSLKQVQNRDKIKIDTIKRMGWIPIIFEDRYFTPESAFQKLISL
jgi:hypothetical protein